MHIYILLDPTAVAAYHYSDACPSLHLQMNFFSHAHMKVLCRKEPNTDFVVLILGQKVVIYAQDKVLLTAGFVQVKS
jgi:hypothetical protein